MMNTSMPAPRRVPLRAAPRLRLDALDCLQAAVLHEDWPTVVAECHRLQLVSTKAYFTVTETAPALPKADGRYDVKAAAKYLGISATQLRRYVSAGELAYERYGHRLSFPYALLEGLLGLDTTELPMVLVDAGRSE